MVEKEIKRERLSGFQIGMVVAVFLICLIGARLITIQNTPDEIARKLLSDWIYVHGKLPVGDEQEIVIPKWGFSYAYRPYLSAILAAAFMKLFSLFTDSRELLLMGSRMCSVLSATACCYFCLKAGNVIFEKKALSILYTVIICFTPQMLFLGMYQNCDSLAAAGVAALIYCLAKGWRKGFSAWDCVVLGAAISVCLLSYYSIYGWLLAGGVVFLVALFKNKEIKAGEAFVKLGIIAFTIIVLAGWFFIRNMILHNGDIFGMASEEISRQQQAALGAYLTEYDNPYEKGMGFFETFFKGEYNWGWYTFKSMIGAFGYLSIWLDTWLYVLYALLILLAIGGYVVFDMFVKKDNDRRQLSVFIFSSAVITVGLSVFQSYFRDFQAQGRYVITVVFAVGYMAASALEKLWAKKKAGNNVNYPALASIIIWLVLAVYVFVGYMTKMFY